MVEQTVAMQTDKNGEDHPQVKLVRKQEKGNCCRPADAPVEHEHDSCSHPQHCVPRATSDDKDARHEAVCAQEQHTAHRADENVRNHAARLEPAHVLRAQRAKVAKFGNHDQRASSKTGNHQMEHEFGFKAPASFEGDKVKFRVDSPSVE